MPVRNQKTKGAGYKDVEKEDGVVVSAKKPGHPRGTPSGGAEYGFTPPETLGALVAPPPLITQQVGAPSYPHTDIQMDPRLDTAFAKLAELMGGAGYEEDLKKRQYEALVAASPQQAVTGAVGAVGSRAGGQVAEARKMSDIQMVQGLAGARVAATEAKNKMAFAAVGEVRNIMQQQLSAWAAAENLGLEAQTVLTNQSTHFSNQMSMELEALINSGMMETEEDWKAWGEYQRKKWDEWMAADTDSKNAIANKLGFKPGRTDPNEGVTQPGGSSTYLVPIGDGTDADLPDDYNEWKSQGGGVIIEPQTGTRETYKGNTWEWDGEKWVKIEAPQV